MAWLLPGSILHANYAKALLHEVSHLFHRTLVIAINQRLFLSNGTFEATHVLLCDSYLSNHSSTVEVMSAQNITQCKDLIDSWSCADRRGVALNGRAHRALNPGRKLNAFNRISKSKDVVRLGDIATLSIGVVTGANKFFVINEDEARQHELPHTTLRPILAKFCIAKGLTLTRTDFRTARAQGLRCLLVDASTKAAPVNLKNILRASQKLNVRATLLFQSARIGDCPMMVESQTRFSLTCRIADRGSS
jgi:hypothetical protein